MCVDTGYFDRLLHYEEVVRFVRFIIVGATGAVVNLSILYLLTSGGVHYLLSGAVAIEAAFLFNFFFNKMWTFDHIEFTSVNEVFRALLRDHGVRSIGMGVNLLFLWALTDLFGIYYLFSQVIGAGFAALWNFVGNVFWTWKL